MIHNSAPAPDRKLVVAIQSDGSRRPLFLVHSLAGELTWMFPMARQLGPEQPLYGFAAPGLYGSGPFFERLESMAAAYLADLRRIQPQGPYRLGGYSFGGVVAYEMARQLQQAGATVERLFLIDAYAPGTPVTRALSRWTVDGFLVQAVANLMGLQWGAGQLLRAGQLPPDALGAQVEIATRHLLDQTDVRHTHDALSNMLSKCQEVMGVHTRLLADYRPAPLPRPLATVLIHNTRGFVGADNALQLPEIPDSDTDPDRGWGPLLCEPPRRHGVDAEHFTLVTAPALEALTRLLAEQLRPAAFGG